MRGIQLFAVSNPFTISGFKLYPEIVFQLLQRYGMIIA